VNETGPTNARHLRAIANAAMSVTMYLGLTDVLKDEKIDDTDDNNNHDNNNNNNDDHNDNGIDKVHDDDKE
jgi:hypothetical protein